MDEEPVNTPVAAAGASNASTAVVLFRKILRTGRLALCRFSAWRKAELLAIATAKSIRASQRYRYVCVTVIHRMHSLTSHM